MRILLPISLIILVFIFWTFFVFFGISIATNDAYAYNFPGLTDNGLTKVEVIYGVDKNLGSYLSYIYEYED